MVTGLIKIDFTRNCTKPKRDGRWVGGVFRGKRKRDGRWVGGFLGATSTHGLMG